MSKYHSCLDRFSHHGYRILLVVVAVLFLWLLYLSWQLLFEECLESSPEHLELKTRVERLEKIHGIWED